MDYEKIFESINRAVESRPFDHGAYADLFSLVRTWETADFARAHEVNKQLRGKVASKLREVSSKEAAFFYDQWRKCLLFDAPHDFDSFMLYIEQKARQAVLCSSEALPSAYGAGFSGYSRWKAAPFDHFHAETSRKESDGDQFCQYALREVPRPIYFDGGNGR